MSYKIEPSLDDTRIITQPMVRNFSTGGGHGPADTITEGDGKFVTQKWQATAGRSRHHRQPRRRCARVASRYRSTAEFATRIRLPGMLYIVPAQPLSARAIRALDTAKAEKMPVHHILTYPTPPRPIHCRSS